MSMNLSADLFNEIVASLRSDGPDSRAQEKRTQGRVGLRCTMDLVPFPTPEGTRPTTVWLRDISINGIGFVSSARVSDRSELIARLPRPNQTPLSILYKVRYCRRLSSDLFSVGASFEHVMPDASGEVATIGKFAKRSAP
ncbi:MAG: hypothetical protein M3O30_06365 [Planctomycetota bacterium]|nr:hypothetical protein [Planctomycetota bacterium]